MSSRSTAPLKTAPTGQASIFRVSINPASHHSPNALTLIAAMNIAGQELDIAAIEAVVHVQAATLGSSAALTSWRTWWMSATSTARIQSAPSAPASTTLERRPACTAACTSSRAWWTSSTSATDHTWQQVKGLECWQRAPLLRSLLQCWCACMLQGCSDRLPCDDMMGDRCADSGQQGSGSHQQEYDGQQLSTHPSYHAGSGDHPHMTPERLAAALQMASDQALGLAAHMDGVDTLGQVPEHPPQAGLLIASPICAAASSSN